MQRIPEIPLKAGSRAVKKHARAVRAHNGHRLLGRTLRCAAVERTGTPEPGRAGTAGWLAQGHRRLYAAAAVVGVVALALLALLPAGGAVSTAKMQELVDIAYSTSGTRCVAASHGRQRCSLKAEKCHGTLLVAPTDSSHFTIVSSAPDQLDSAACVKETSVAGFE